MPFVEGPCRGFRKFLDPARVCSYPFVMPPENPELAPFKFDRMELAGSLGDLGTLVPLSAGMILLNGLSPTTVFIWVGLFYVLSGLYYRLPVPVQPLKLVAAIAIAAPDKINEEMIAAAGITFGVIFLVLSLSGAMKLISRVFTKPVIRGIQLGLGLILIRKGVLFIASRDLFVSSEAGISSGNATNIIIGIFVFILVLVLLNNNRLPAALAALAVGMLAGVLWGGFENIEFALGPGDVHFMVPGPGVFGSAFVLLVLPQIPLTIGNSCIGVSDTAKSLFPDNPRPYRTRPDRFAMTIGLINIPAGFMGAMPMCHGAGGLAAHYRFGARTGGSNLIIGAIFLVMALAFGKMGLSLITLIPNAVLGTLLVFAGIELCLLIGDIKERGALFVAVLIAGIALAGTNMALAFGAGIVADFIIRRAKIKI